MMINSGFILGVAKTNVYKLCLCGVVVVVGVSSAPSISSFPNSEEQKLPVLPPIIFNALNVLHADCSSVLKTERKEARFYLICQSYALLGSSSSFKETGDWLSSSTVPIPSLGKKKSPHSLLEQKEQEKFQMGASTIFIVLASTIVVDVLVVVVDAVSAAATAAVISRKLCRNRETNSIARIRNRNHNGTRGDLSLSITLTYGCRSLTQYAWYKFDLQS
ncbi:hypothetical protein M0802_009247 [Mischocyttarus mexicanus]|nr:hypothetical protein M0802_009247 [Mischocyttarus mexicanus]